MDIKWFNIADYEQKFKPSNFFIGARGIGKTYSAFSYVIEKNEPFIYLRNTDVQLDECCSTFGNPFKRWARDHGRDIFMKREKKHAVIYERIGEEVKELGYGWALSASADLRGVDLSDAKYCIFDEFIEKRTLSYDQGKNYNHFYETVNRNRELLGEKPFYVILLSNAQMLNNSILVKKGLVSGIENLIKTGQKSFSTKSCFVCLPVSEVSDLKKQSAFYQGMEGTTEYKEAIENKFANDSFYGIKKRPLKEYTPMCMIDNIYLYKHKSTSKVYATYTTATNCPEFTSKDNFAIFYRSYGRFLDVMAATGDLEYENFTIKSELTRILKI